MTNKPTLCPIPNIFVDHRGSFNKIYDKSVSKDFESIKQINVVSNPKANTFRGLHLQRGAHAENKIIYVNKGSILDIVVSIDSNSKDFLQPTQFEIHKNESVLLVPKSYLHGYLTLESDTEVIYMSDKSYYSSCQYTLNIRNNYFDFSLTEKIEEISENDLLAPSQFRVDEFNKCQCS